eukprot:259212-Pyramimonas_sp.AAC.1
MGVLQPLIVLTKSDHPLLHHPFLLGRKLSALPHGLQEAGHERAGRVRSNETVLEAVRLVQKHRV